jgi:predicted nucleic-acid-binding Zn-ribbon protein
VRTISAIRKESHVRTRPQCPKCGGTKLYVCENRQPDAETTAVHPLVVATVTLPEYDLVGAEFGEMIRTPIGAYETWICAACGFTEWYAKDPERLMEKLSKRIGSGIRIVNMEPSEPYR